MTSPPLELEGSWEEILTHASELAGCRVRLTVLAPSSHPISGRPSVAQERDPERVAHVRSLRGRFADTSDERASDLLHRERQADKESEEQASRESPL
jgi:hypothetical protein